MTSSPNIKIKGLSFNATEPTAISLDRLYAWVVWQFPRHKGNGHFGAVHPPDAQYGWYPAIINTSKKQALVFAHLKEEFNSPESAAKHLEQNASSETKKTGS